MSHYSDLSFVAPQISQAVIKATPNQYEAFKTPLQKQIEAGRARIKLDDPATFDKDLEDLLHHIEDRLALGLYEAWISDQAYGQTAEKDDLKKLIGNLKVPAEPRNDVKGTRAALDPILAAYPYWATPDEKWARVLSEMMVFTAYGDAELICMGTQAKGTMYETYKDGVVPVQLACQQLSTYAIMMRGFGTDKVGTGCGCSATTIDNKALFKDDPNTSRKSQAAAGVAPTWAKIDEIVKMSVVPGSVVAFNHGGPGETGQDKGPITHIGTVLRKYGNKIQFIDTGVLVGDTEGGGGGEGGTTDHTFCESRLPAANDCVAVGVLKDASDLEGAVKTAMQCRPLGLARLAIVDLSQPAAPLVRYVSKVVHMQFPVSYLIWSLRGLPIENLRVLWMTYAPQPGSFTRSLKDKGLGTAAPDIYAASLPDAILHPVQIVRGEADGSAVVARRKEDKGLDGWVENFQAPTTEMLKKSPKPAPEMGQSRDGKAALHLLLNGSPVLPIFSAAEGPLWKKAVGKRFLLRDRSAKAGELEDKAPGNTFMTFK
jgi:hypothetical protein